MGQSLSLFFFLVFHTSDFIPLPLRLGDTVVRDGGHISPEEKRLELSVVRVPSSSETLVPAHERGVTVPMRHKCADSS